MSVISTSPYGCHLNKKCHMPDIRSDAKDVYWRNAHVPRVPLGQGRSTVTPRCVWGQDIPRFSVPSQKRLVEGGRLTAVGSAGSGWSAAVSLPCLGLAVVVTFTVGLWAPTVVVVITGGVVLLGSTVDLTSSETVGTVRTSLSYLISSGHSKKVNHEVRYSHFIIYDGLYIVII